MTSSQSRPVGIVSTDSLTLSTSVDKPVIWARLVDFAERRTLWFLAIWIAVFGAAVVPRSLSALSYDELLTYHGAKAPSIAQFYAGITHFDFNPPLLYGLVRVSMWTFGDSAVAIRLPSMLSFLGAACILFWHIQRRAGGAYGLLAIGALFSSGFFYYATEARPYALALLFFTLAFVCWSEATNERKWSLAHAGLAIGIAGMFMSHCFAALFAFSIAAGEFARARAERSINWDRRIWIALGLPVPLLALYLPLLQRPSELLYALNRVAQWTTLPVFYSRAVVTNLACFGLAIAAALLVPPTRNFPKKAFFASWEWVFIVTAVLTPILVIAYTIHGKMPFWDRYAICLAVPIALLFVGTFERLARRSPAAALLAAFLICINFCTHHLVGLATFTTDAEHVSRLILHVPPNLPIVAAGGSRFLELDHAEPSAFVSRLYYLTDREAAIRYTHFTAFQDFGIIKQVYPAVRAHVEPYRVFVASHTHFLIFFFPGDEPESWIVQKLKADGATVRAVPGAPLYLEVLRP